MKRPVTIQPPAVAPDYDHRQRRPRSVWVYNGRPCQVGGSVRVQSAAGRRWHDALMVAYLDGQEPGRESVPAGKFNRECAPAVITEGAA